MFNDGDLVVATNSLNELVVGVFNRRPHGFETVEIRMGCEVLLAYEKDLVRYSPHNFKLLPKS